MASVGVTGVLIDGPSLERLVLTLWGPSTGNTQKHLWKGPEVLLSVSGVPSGATEPTVGSWLFFSPGQYTLNSQHLGLSFPGSMSVFNQQSCNNTLTQKGRDGTLGSGSETQREAQGSQGL